MKTLFRKKWFRRLCQTLLAACSLLVFAYVFIDWHGARMKRDVIAQMRAEGRPTSVAEMLKPMPRDEDNFAMIPILAQARDEWWFDKSHGQGRSPDQARVKLEKMICNTPKRYLSREGYPDVNIWKQYFNLTGSDAECLDGYDRKFGEILADLRSGVSRPETVSPMFHRLAAMSEKDWLNLSSGYTMELADVALSLGFRAELALAAGRPEVAHESLLIGIRLSELIGSEGFLVSELAQVHVIGRLQPTLARALLMAGWDKSQIFSLRNEYARMKVLDGFRRAFDVESFSSFAMFEGARKRGQRNIAIAPERGTWKSDFLIEVAKRLPMGCYQGDAALWARSKLQLRGELGESDDLRKWFQACALAEKPGQAVSSWEFWLHPIKDDGLAAAFKNACRAQTLIQQTLLACDLETYRLDHGSYPARLQESGSSAIIDSMTGEPYIYRLTDSSYQLYSIGSDGKDDGGRRQLGNKLNQPDWIWRD